MFRFRNLQLEILASPKSIACAVCVLLLQILLLSTNAHGKELAVKPEADAKPRQPNIVLIMADDLGWNDLGYQGSEIKTPQVDRLAANGLQLDRFYVQPSCSPTRASLMTGKSSLRLGITGALTILNDKGLPLEHQLLPQYLKGAGYRTGLIGKWHLGFKQRDYLPTSRGFDYFYGHLTGGIGYWDHVHGEALDWQRNNDVIREDGYSTHLLAADAERFIENHKPEQPFFLFLSFNAPHLPNEAPESTVADYQFVPDSKRRVHAAMITELDNAIGRVIATLEQQDILDETLVWFMSDNGGANPTAFSPRLVSMASTLDEWFDRQPLPLKQLEFLKTNILDGRGDNQPLRKAKRSIYEGGVRVPSFIYWHGHLDSRVVTEMISIEDVTPTLLSLLQQNTQHQQFDGVNRWPMLRYGENTIADDFAVMSPEGEALFRYPWKLIQLGTDEFELYELESDPLETDNLAKDYPDKVKELAAALQNVPRGARVNIPFWKTIFYPGLFGGEERNQPWISLVN